MMNIPSSEKIVTIPINTIQLEGALAFPERARGLVIFAHGSGSSRLSPRNTFVARVLQQEGIGTLLMDLLTREEDMHYKTRFDIDLLTERLIQATYWLQKQPEINQLAIGYFGASTGAAAALRATSALGTCIRTVVSRGGRPDLAEDVLERVQSPTLLIVGGNDEVVLQLNRAAFAKLSGKKDLVIVPGASHLFEEPGTLEQVAHVAAQWFKQYL